MRVCLLSAGPSLPRVRPDGFDVYIGVNTAVQFHAVDYWSCGDQDRFEAIAPHCLGLPALFTIETERDKMLARNAQLLSRHRVITWQDVCSEIDGPAQALSWSCPSALMLAAYLKADEVHCYGVDMNGSADCTGQETRFRNADRWQKEYNDGWKPIRDFIDIPVIRHNGD